MRTVEPGDAVFLSKYYRKLEAARILHYEDEFYLDNHDVFREIDRQKQEHTLGRPHTTLSAVASW